MSTDFSTICEQRYSRRNLLKSAAIVAAYAGLPARSLATAAASTPPAFGFAEVPRGMDATHHLPPGYRADILLRWGDALSHQNEGEFDPLQQTATLQAGRFGYNNDFIAYFPLNDASHHGLLCINHEFPTPELMFKGRRKGDSLSNEEIRIEMAALGCSIIEVKRTKGQWQPVVGSYNRRITATTPITISGPAAKHVRMKTSADPQGVNVLGTFANCAGGKTPWGTYLSCEENVDEYFLLGNYTGPEHANHTAMKIDNDPYQQWHRADPRFSVEREPNEPNRFGWIVEIDPLDPQRIPVKRTALGRFKHESATVAYDGASGQTVVYSGDDEAFQHIYRFVSDAGTAAKNRLDHGTLYVARFDADGSVQWLPLIFGKGPLTPENGFDNQGDVLIETRRAAKLLGATRMDRPEGIALRGNKIYISLTKNPLRTRTDPVNRRAPNPMGYILELTVEQARHVHHAGHAFRWDIFLEGGSPGGPSFAKGQYGGPLSPNGWLACPDNVTFDPAGHLWIATDGQPAAIASADGLYATATSGLHRARPHCFFRAPIGAEVCGPCFTPDGKTLFLAVQHPGEGSHYDAPSTHWPDFNDTMPPRPAVIAIQKDDGGPIGS